ncbi:MAG TPA: hypothetical protein VK835_08295 [Bacteroidia bacterium]|jgi:hypothetical protein|nr:hypothetical protein [Bacteroidia bacterium]
MKKVILVLVLAAGLFTSCKKDYTCVCKANSGTTASTLTIHATKSTATSDCNALSSNGNGLACAIQ